MGTCQRSYGEDKNEKIYYRFGLCNFDLSFLITVVKVIKLRLIWQPSLSLAPSAFVCEALSLPAKSTKFCKKWIYHLSYRSIANTIKYIFGKIIKRTNFTRLATNDLTQSEFSRSVLSIVCIYNQRTH